MPMYLHRPLAIAVSALALACVTSLASAAPAAQGGQGLSTDKDKTSYAIGMQIGTGINRSLENVKGEVDVNVVLRAIGVVVRGEKPQMTITEAQAQLETFGKRMQAKQAAQAKAQGDKNLAEGTKFLTANAKKAGVKTTASGLQYMVVTQGKGTKPKATDTVKVNYSGSLLDGTVFDASAKHGGPVEMQLDGVIPGWTEGVQLMPVGSKYVFWIPAKLAYGDKSSGPIGPNATLKFEIELLSIAKK